MYRSQMTRDEREARSQLKPYITYGEFVRATLSVRDQTCGKKNCRCTKGKKHQCIVLTRSKGGKVLQLYIPRDKEKRAREWVKNYWQVWELLERISNSYWERLRKKG